MWGLVPHHNRLVKHGKKTEKCNTVDSKQKIPYKERRKELKLLPLSMYFELHGLLLFCSITDHKCDIKTSDYISRNTNKRTRQGSNSSFNIPKTRLKRTDDNFWTRNGTLHNILSKHIDLTTKENRKARIAQPFWKIFKKSQRSQSMYLEDTLPMH